MDSTRKKELIIRGALRSVVTAGVVAGICHAHPELAPYCFICGYGGVMGSMKLTKMKMKAHDEWEVAPKPTQPWLVHENEPKENLFEKIETRMIHPVKTAEIVSEKIKAGYDAFQNYKKTRLMIRHEEKMWKLKYDMDQVKQKLETEKDR